MFSFRTTSIGEQLDKSLVDGKVAVIEDDCSYDAASGIRTGELFVRRGNRVSSPEEADAVVADIADCGGRSFEPVSRLILLIERLALMGDGAPSLYVVDHPNPAGRIVEGSMPSVICEPGVAKVAHRHGLTVGELSHLHYTDIGAKFPLHIISASASGNASLLMPWSIPLSDDVPGMFTAMMYPGQSLWKWTNITPGLGTARPYEMFGSPFVRHDDDDGVPCPEGVRMRPCTFTPSKGMYAGELCRGYQILLLPGAQYHSLLHALELLHHFSERYSEFSFSPVFPEKLGDPVAEAYLRGEIDFDIVQESVKAEEQKWIRKAKRFCLYEDQPYRIK